MLVLDKHRENDLRVLNQAVDLRDCSRVNGKISGSLTVKRTRLAISSITGSGQLLARISLKIPGMPLRHVAHPKKLRGFINHRAMCGRKKIPPKVSGCFQAQKVAGYS